jgi:hypothetical protein
MAVSAGRINAQFREVRNKRNNKSSNETWLLNILFMAG